MKTGLFNGESVSILIPAKKAWKLLFVINQRNHHTCLWFSTTTSVKPFPKNTSMLFRFYINIRRSSYINTLAKVNKRQPRLVSKDNPITIHWTFNGPHLDYADVLYNQAFNITFTEKLESEQKVRQKKKNFQELSLKFLRDRSWCRRLCLFYKVLKNEHPEYLLNLFLVIHSLYSTRKMHNIPF